MSLRSDSSGICAATAGSLRRQRDGRRAINATVSARSSGEPLRRRAACLGAVRVCPGAHRKAAAPDVQEGSRGAPERGSARLRAGRYREWPRRVELASTQRSRWAPRPTRYGGSRGGHEASGPDEAQASPGPRPSAEVGDEVPAVRSFPGEETAAGTPAKRRALRARYGVPAF